MTETSQGLAPTKVTFVIAVELAPARSTGTSSTGSLGTGTSGSIPVTITAAFGDGSLLSSTFAIAVDDPHHSANYPNRIIGTVGSTTAITPEAFDTHGRTAYTLVCGSLPAGMTLDASTGVISGTPTAQGDYPTPLRIRQADAYGTVDASLIMVVGTAATPWIRYPEHPIASSGMPVSITPTLSELPSGATYRLTGRLPKGLRLDARTGAISGTPNGYAQGRPLTVAAVGANGGSLPP